MKMDLKHFKITHQDDKSTTFTHKRGHKITVAHAGLPTEQVQEMMHLWEGGSAGLHADYSKPDTESTAVKKEKFVKGYKNEPQQQGHEDSDSEYAQRQKESHGNAIPRLSLPAGMSFADGGEVDQPEMGTPDIMSQLGMQQPAPNMSVMPQAGATGDFSPQANSEQLSNVQIPQPQAPTAPSVLDQGNAQVNSMQSGANKMIQGINAEAGAIGQQGKQEAAASQNNQTEMKAMQGHFNQQSQAIDAERMGVYNDLKAGHIEPKHFLQSMGGFDKAMTAIGLVLGGAGSGLTHGPNVALDFLNKQIDRDIEGQKAEMGKKENLLSHLNQQFGNVKDAAVMAKAMQGDMYMSKMQEIAAQSKNPIAIAKAQQAAAQFQMSIQPQIEQVKMNQALMSGVKSGQVPVERLVNSMVPKEHQKAVFDELGKARNMNENEGNILRNFDQASKDNTILRTGAGVLRTPASLTAMQNLLLPAIKDNEGRVNEFEFDTVKNLLPAPGDTDAKIAKKREGLINFIQSKKAAPTAAGYGIPVPQSPKGFNRR